MYVYTTKQQNIEEVGKVQERRQQLITVIYISSFNLYLRRKQLYMYIYTYILADQETDKVSRLKGRIWSSLYTQFFSTK